MNEDKIFQATKRHFFRVLPIALLMGNAIAACGASPPSTEDAPPQPYLDVTSSPPTNEILPRHGVLLLGTPEILDGQTLRGRWHAGACVLVMSGDGLSGEARVSGACSPGLIAISRWEIEPDHRQRLSLHGQDGTTLWAGVSRADGALAGVAAREGVVTFTR